MRCKFCGSKSLHNDTQRKNFSGGKAVAGAITFGVVGATAGLIGKNIKGYRCGACGAFCESTMDIITESQINSAISEAEKGNTIMFDYYKNQYPNIQARVPVNKEAAFSASAPVIQKTTESDQSTDNKEGILKGGFFYGKKKKDSPVFIEYVSIIIIDDKDKMRLKIRNTTAKTLRSVYLTVKVYDDTNDLLSTVKCVYQNVSAVAGDYLPEDKLFDLETDLSYRIEINCDKAAFENGEVWHDNDSENYEVIEPKRINIDNFPRFNYIQRNLGVNVWEDKNTLSIPMVYEKYWQCVCGLPINTGEECPYCKASAEKVLDAVSQEALIAREKEIIKEFAAEDAKESVDLYNESIEKKYKNAVSFYKKGDLNSLKNSLACFKTIKDYKDSADYLKKIPDKIKISEEEKRKAEESRKESIYKRAVEIMDRAATESECKEALKEFETITGWRDTDKKIELCKQKIEDIIAKKKKVAKVKKIKIASFISVGVVCVICVITIVFSIIVNNEIESLRKEIIGQTFSGTFLTKVYYGDYSFLNGFYQKRIDETQDYNLKIIDETHCYLSRNSKELDKNATYTLTGGLSGISFNLKSKYTGDKTFIVKKEEYSLTLETDNFDNGKGLKLIRN